MAVAEAIPNATKPIRLRMSYEEFLQWSDEDTHAEWVNGEVIVQMPPKNVHQVTLGFLYQLLGLFVDLFHLGRVQVAPFEVKLSPTGPAREPDIFFLNTEGLNRLTEDRLSGAPDLVIEIVSADSVRRDRHEKFQEYRQAGVREYWIIDPRRGKQRADFYRLDDTGQYDLVGTEDDERVESHVLPGFWLRPAWLWQADSLNPLVCALEIEGVAVTINQHLQQAQRTSQADS